ncbi:helix-turn-helix domain-containing protein [Paracoccus shanxieyensis]|uniref:Helix-turn-helix domain-containing protein n=1 Tax=Paracoccus shanxieyensis TaxID=2675752 RepID=A0A6L6IYS5_9RHOB|nr:helix-turn-helix domain-containing protein [Paracoccus shanxieyensis]MTH65059.1 hypothetical protein [Paracoccus shanxieyensis]MTH88203.1 hypothetical protein [Paracoccus shanxieyensis]
MSYRLVEMVLQSSIADPTEVAVMIALAHHADKFCSCYPSIQRICQLSRYKERAVQGAIKRLSDRGVIAVKTGGGRGGASFYTIFPSALNPAANAPIKDDKPRSKCAVSDEETPQQMRETPHLTTGNPAANAPEPVKEPVKNQAKPCEREASPDRTQAIRDAIISDLGLTGRELNTRGVFVVGGMDPHNLSMSISVWGGHGLNDEQIIAAIRGKIASERAKDAGFMPRSVKLFDGPVADFAKRLAASGAPARPQEFATPEAADAKAEIDREWAELGSRSDAEAAAKREALMGRYRNLKAASGM